MELLHVQINPYSAWHWLDWIVLHIKQTATEWHFLCIFLEAGMEVSQMSCSFQSYFIIISVRIVYGC